MSTSISDRIARLEQFIVDERLHMAAIEADADDPFRVALTDIDWLLRVAAALPDLRERAEKADRTLKEMATTRSAVEAPRLLAKAEGTRTVLSYINEKIRELEL